jgi:uncharacterized protein with HEPN domain
MDKAEVLIEGFTYREFEEDFRTNFAVIRALEIIGEATKRLPMSTRQQYPGIRGQEWPACATALSTDTTPWTFRPLGM